MNLSAKNETVRKTHRYKMCNSPSIMILSYCQSYNRIIKVSYSIVGFNVLTIPGCSERKDKRGLFTAILYECGVFAVLFFADKFIVDTRKITEGGTFRQAGSLPFQQSERCLLDPLVNPRNTVVMASQTRLDGSQPNSYRQSFVPHFNSFFLFGMVASNLFETIPSPSPLFLPSPTPSEAIRSGFENHTKNGFNSWA